MTAQLPNTEYTLEDLHEIAYRGSYDDMQRSLARELLAAYEQEPFMYGIADPDGKAHIDEYCVCAEPAPLEDSVDELNDYREADGDLNYAVVPLYRHPAPSIPTMPADLHPDTQKLVVDFSTALAEKLYKAQLKYGYSDNWKRDDWSEQCLQHFQQHISKGDPRDVAAYCAFMWFHGWSTTLPAPSIPAVPEEMPAGLFGQIVNLCAFNVLDKELAQKIWSACRAAMLNGGVL